MLMSRIVTDPDKIYKPIIGTYTNFTKKKGCTFEDSHWKGVTLASSLIGK